MLKANENEKILIDKLNDFKKEALRTLNDVKTGIEIAIDFFGFKTENNKSPKILLIIHDLCSVIEKFKITTEKGPSNDDSKTMWIYVNDSIQYKGSKVTEKTLSFALMSFEKETHTLFTTLEQTQKGEFICFCYNLKFKLHKIIEDYMTA